MRNRLLLYLLFFVPVLTISCRTDFDVNEKWTEIDVVYGLLDANDTAQYIKISKAFLNQDQSAYKIAGIEDSLFHKDSLDVRMQEMRNGNVQNDVKLQKVYLTNKDSGTFSAPGQYLYKTPADYKLNADVVYRLIVRNTSTNVTAISTTPIVGNISPTFPNSQSTITFPRGLNRPVNFGSGRNARFYEMNIFINYSEYDAATNALLKEDAIRWPVFSNYLNTGSAAGNDIRFTIRGDDFYRIIADNLQPKSNVYRKLGLIDFQITGGGEEIFNYMNVYKPAIGIVQKKPEYTNIENGQGIFSSRNKTVISVPASNTTIDELTKSGTNTSNLNFRK